ncbi:MAG: hypothetical protein Q7J98_03720 [Kiritimatiellia bacterium]|nr:hypothetical protein [Kiritimatiellia bacterium]
MNWINKTALVGVALLLLATGCGQKMETPETAPAEERAAPSTDYIETGDLAALQKRGCLRFLLLRQDEAYLPRAGDPPNRAVELAAGFCATIGNAVEVIDVSEHKPRRIPSAKWRELIKKVWEADPLLCPKCSREMRIVALIDDRKVIARILRHLGLWSQGVRVLPARAPPEIVDRVIEPWLDDPFPDYDTEPVMMYANG